MKTISLRESTFVDLLRSLKRSPANDENATIILVSKESVTTDEDQWIVLACKSRKYYRRVIYAAADTNASSNEPTVILTNTNLYNLNASSSSPTLPQINRNILIYDKPKEFTPKHATNAKIALIDSATESIETAKIDVCLKNYFATSKYLHAGDVVCIDLRIHAPEIVYCKPNLQNVHFKICSIEGPEYHNVEITFGYLINSEHTTVHLISSVECFLPDTRTECDYKDVTVDEVSHASYDVIPGGLRDVNEEMEKMILPFLLMEPAQIQLSPIFLLCGKSGTGKRTLCSAFAKKYGLHYRYENCTTIQTNQPAQTETVISNIFASVSKSSPIILHLHCIETLCEDEFGNSDDRTIEHFVTEAKSLTSTYPVIVLCTSSNETKITPPLQRIFLQTIRIGPLDQNARHETLNWIMKKNGLQCPRVDEIVRSVSNFVFADLVQLVSRAMLIHFQNINFEKEIPSGQYMSLDYDDFAGAVREMNATYADSIGAPEIPNVTWDDVGGLTELKEEILSSLLTPISSSGLYRSGLLLHGPPGTGKTMLAKAVATECKYNFLSVKGPELLNMYVGQSEKNVREVFARARESAPCIVFFDELDSLAPKRGQSGGSGSVMDRVVSQLLAEMDGIQKSPGIFILAATNRPDLIDSALLRPGRLDKMLFVGMCNDKESKMSVLRALTRKFNLSAEFDFESIILQLPTRSLSGADLYGICSNAWLNAARRHIKLMNSSGNGSHGTVMVTMEDMLLAISQFKLDDLNSD